MHSASLRLPREDGERHATWLEIFFDLIFAVIVVQLSSRLSSPLDINSIIESCALFMPVMWTWASYTVFAARFDNNDFIHWVITFVIMFAGVIMAIQIPFALEEGANGFAVGFIISQISLIALYSRTNIENLAHKKMITLYLIGYGAAVVCWLVSIYFDSPAKFVLWFVGMSIYFATPWIGRKKILSKAPLDPFYIPERFGSLTVIILGQTVASVVFGLEFAHWQMSSVLMGILSFILAVLIWVQYYLFNQMAQYKCTLGSGQPYIYTHIPFIISLIVIGVCTQDFIQASTVIHENVNVYFCAAIIINLLSFYLFFKITVRKYKLVRMAYTLSVLAIILLFFLHSLSSLVIMAGIVLIFSAILGVQYFSSRKKSSL